MKKQWLAVIRDDDISVAKVAAGKNKEMKVMSLSVYRLPENGLSLNEQSQDFAGIKDWLHRQRVPLKQLKLAVSNFGLITRVIALPQMTNNDLEKLITDHIDQYFTLNIQNYLIDYRVLNKYWENGKPMINVLLAAFPREKMQAVWSLCRYLGFEPMVLDLTADCLARLYSHLAIPGDMAIVSLNGDKVEFVLLENGVFFLYSDMEMDMRTVSQNIDRKISEQKLSAIKLESEGEQDSLPVFQENKIFAPSPEEMTLYLSSYTDDAELFSAQDTPLFNNLQENKTGNVQELSEEKGSWDDREQILNELIGLEAEAWDEVNAPRDKNKRPEELSFQPADFFEEEDRDIFPNNQRDTHFDFDLKGDDPYFSLNDLGFSIEPLPNENQAEEQEDFRQAAMLIEKKSEEPEEFALEDLFVPMESLEEELVITLTQQQVDDDTEDSLENKAELKKNLNPVLTTLSELLSFFAARHFGQTVHSIYLTGEFCTLPYLEEIFQENLGVKTAVGFPNGWKPRFEGNSRNFADGWQKYGSIYGLALRED
ncbi:MAG: hypothetical protein AWM53_00662 [Candidatus Dichloromethanomonas elyunquensis]|nr:MAG: hypothetical protein AWM53_00662 [Candidatus Dichloromethanomonas elyunquensis]